MKTNLKLIVFVLLILFPLVAFGAINDIENAGFVPGPIWFSKYPIFVGDEIKIYTALYNNSEHNISGELHFLSNETLIGSTNFEMLAGSGTKDLSISWVANKGDVEISAEIKNAFIINAETEDSGEINLGDKKIAKNAIFIDHDNDKDGIGNINDPDDDNDGKSDIDEITEGTNPFVADQEISSSSEITKGETNNKLESEKSLIDRIDDTVMTALNKVTKNRVDIFVEDFSATQVEKLLDKKEEIINKLKTNIDSYEQMSVKLDISKTSTTSSPTTISSDKNIASPIAATPKEVNDSKIKNRIGLFFKNLFSNLYLYIINTLIFLLNHTFFLFLSIFILIYLIIRKIFRFFLN